MTLLLMKTITKPSPGQRQMVRSEQISPSTLVPDDISYYCTESNPFLFTCVYNGN